jgi:23S rRNA G2445 N2-methylase RlmL
MRVYLVIHPGLESTALLETRELIGVEGVIRKGVVEFTCDSKEKLLVLLYRGQSFRRILIGVGRFKNDKIKFDKFPWQDFFSKGMTYKLELEHVKGVEERDRLASIIGGEVYRAVRESCGFSPVVDFKKPDVIIVVNYTEEEYLIGIAMVSEEVHKRHYRIFAHQASITGDIAYHLIQSSSFVVGDKLLCGFVKDGTLAIEAACFVNEKAVQKFSEPDYKKFPCFLGMEFVTKNDNKSRIFAFDESQQSIIAARKNAKIAGVYGCIDFQKYLLEDLDVKYGEGFFDRVIFQLTTKDENSINELYYQSKYILRKGGILMLVTRKNFEINDGEVFKILKSFELIRGDSVLKVWVLEKSNL